MGCSPSPETKSVDKEILVCYNNGDKDTIIIYDFDDLKLYNNGSIEIFTGSNIVGINTHHYTINNIRWYLFLDEQNTIEFHPVKKITMFTFIENLTQFGETCLGITFFLMLFYVVLNIMYIVNNKMYNSVYNKYSRDILLYLALASFITYWIHSDYVAHYDNTHKETIMYFYIFPIILGLMFAGIVIAIKKMVVDYFTPKDFKLDARYMNTIVTAYTAILHTHGYVLFDYRGKKLQVSAMIDPMAHMEPGEYIPAGTRCYISNINEGIALVKPFDKIIKM